MMFGSLVFVCAICGIIGFYMDLHAFTYIGLAMALFESIIGLYTGTLKTMNTSIIAGIIGWIIVKDFWLGIAIGICFENVIMFIAGIIMMIITKKAISNYEKNELINYEKETFNEESTKN